jgi:hypothetical protein
MNPTDDPLADIFGNLKARIESLGRTYQTASNQWAALQAQNADIAGGRWTLNNAVYQFNQLQPVGQLAVMAAIAYLAAKLLKG